MYVNRFFLTSEGNTFALHQVTETENKYLDEALMSREGSDLVPGADGTSLWAWGARLFWTYAEAVDSVEQYDKTTAPLRDTRTVLIDLRYGVPMEVAL